MLAHYFPIAPSSSQVRSECNLKEPTKPVILSYATLYMLLRCIVTIRKMRSSTCERRPRKAAMGTPLLPCRGARLGWKMEAPESDARRRGEILTVMLMRISSALIGHSCTSAYSLRIHLSMPSIILSSQSFVSQVSKVYNRLSFAGFAVDMAVSIPVSVFLGEILRQPLDLPCEVAGHMTNLMRNFSSSKTITRIK